MTGSTRSADELENVLWLLLASKIAFLICRLEYDRVG